MNGSTIQPVQIVTPVEKKSGVKTGCVALVGVLTAGRDKPYAFGLAAALAASAVNLDFVCGDELDIGELRDNSHINILNLRGDQRENAALKEKIFRVIAYYWRLIFYATTTQTKIFHILWNNKFELFDRTLLMAYYKLLGKKIVLTAHNVNIGKRDSNDSFLNRLSLKIQYRLCNHIFVHTQKMKDELISEFGISEEKISVIPLGVNNSVPDTTLTEIEARRWLDLDAREKVILFFGRIAPYKGLEFLVEAFEILAKGDKNLCLVIVGQPKGSENYWNDILQKINQSSVRGQMILKIEFIPDADAEIYFKAADVLILPYTHIFQSGILILAYTFGLPVIAADVGSLAEEIVEGETGFIFEPKNVSALGNAIQKFFSSDLFRELPDRRLKIQNFIREKNSWSTVGSVTTAVYSKLLNA